MTILYLNHSILKLKHIETKEACYELGHWYTSTEFPDTAGKRIIGYFKTYEDAENHHNDMLVNGLIGGESA